MVEGAVFLLIMSTCVPTHVPLRYNRLVRQRGALEGRKTVEFFDYLRLFLGIEPEGCVVVLPLHFECVRAWWYEGNSCTHRFRSFRYSFGNRHPDHAHHPSRAEYSAWALVQGHKQLAITQMLCALRDQLAAEHAAGAQTGARGGGFLYLVTPLDIIKSLNAAAQRREERVVSSS